ncbi:MAG TPA: carbon-nitrogen hydrolase family protein [Candidatus Bathyarchaeia archaeon]|nr:carbon-nitrogen hydrolase family protein [Candidatus Bathyarchaeia archaeon]
MRLPKTDRERPAAPIMSVTALCILALVFSGGCASTGGTKCSSPPDLVRVALMHGIPEKWNLDANFAVFLEQLEAASDKGADVFITPECWLDGYAAPDKKSTPDRLRQVAQPLESSPYLRRVADEARQKRIWICFGFTSLEEENIYNAAGLWDSGGNLLGVYHKTHLQAHDLQFSPGNSLPVFPSPWGPLGIMICADRRWPETARVLRLQGARLILNPTYGFYSDLNEAMMRTRSYENECFIAFTHPRLSLVTDPRGRIAAKRLSDSPGILVVDLALDKATTDKHLDDRRPDLYQLIGK